MEDFKTKLRAVAEGDANALASFGLERRYVNGRQAMPSAVHEWDQRFLLSGRGLARSIIHRSLGDGGGEPTGVFQATFAPDLIRTLAGALADSGALEYQPGHIDAGDLLIRYRYSVLGEIRETVASMDQVPPLESVRNFFRGVTALDRRVRSSPLRTLLLECDLHGAPAAGKRMRIPATLRLRNTGTQGHWVLHPAAMVTDGDRERRYGSWCAKVKTDDGSMPILPSYSLGVLEPVTPLTDPEKRLVWLEGGSSVEVPCSAIVNFTAAGEYYFKAAYMTFEGDTTFEGQPRWIGAAFSEALELVVR